MASSSSSSTRKMELRVGSSKGEYDSWRKEIVLVLESSNLVGYINGELPEDHNDWKQSDDQIVKDSILQSLSDELVLKVERCATSTSTSSSRQVWLHLESIFSTPSLPAITSSSSPQPQPQDGMVMPLKLYKAALRGDWNETREILKELHPDGVARAALNSGDRVLHIAVGTGKAIPYLRNLVDYMTPASLDLRNGNGERALDVAARRGNVAAARILVEKRPDMVMSGILLLVKAAAESGHRPTTDFFMERMGPHVDAHESDNGVLLLNALINSDFFDLAFDLVVACPDLATRQHASGHYAWRTVALKHDAFASGAQFNFWERLIYSCLTVSTSDLINSEGDSGADIEDPSCCSTLILKRKNKRAAPYDQFIWRLMHAVPCLKRIYGEKVKHHQALQLVACLCEHMESMSYEDSLATYADPMLKAARLGIHEVIEAIVDTFPPAIYYTDHSTERIFLHTAVENRCEKVFNLMYQMSDYKDAFSSIKDKDGDTLLHLVARLAPSHKLNRVPGAALQMQHELQWFKEVEKFVQPYERERENYKGQTPRMIFTEEHNDLKAEGEKWMKDTANSCSIAAALIATVVFAAAITVPGGNAESGSPLFLSSGTFIIFAVSDAISLFTSSTSLLMFLSILTSRYAEEDFLHALPKRLCVGLFTLFLSILFMMVAFSATIFLVFGEKSPWVLIPVAVLACMPVTSFVLLQFPLLVDVISSTYGRGFFRKQSDRPFH